MALGEVGDLLEQKVHGDFKPGSSSGAQREDCELGFQRQKEGGGSYGGVCLMMDLWLTTQPLK